MTVALAGMTLHTDNDNESGWAGTDGPDAYYVATQGTNSESWLVSKNNSETGTLTKSSDISGTDNLFNVWMKSDLSYYYTSVKVKLISTAGNYREYTLATAANPEVSGDFKAFSLDVNNGGTETGTFVPASLSSVEVTVDNSASGNIRSVINNWIDAMYYGSGLTVSGTTTGDAMFTEAAAVDENPSNRYGVLADISGKIFAQGNLTLTGTALTSKNESLTFVDNDNGLNTYKLTASGTVTFDNSLIDTSGSAKFAFTSVAATSFGMTGGGFSNASAVDFDSGQTISGANFISCGELDPNGAAVSNCKFINSVEAATGALIVNSDTEAENCSDLQFDGYEDNNTYAIYVAAAVTEFDMDNWVFSDPNNTTDYALYWAGTSGTLTVNALNGTNLVTAGCTAASGGTVTVQNANTLTIIVRSEATGVLLTDARVHVEAAAGGPLAEGTVIINKELTGADGTVVGTINGSDQPFVGLVAEAASPDFYVPKPISGTIYAGGTTVNVGLVTDE